MKYSRILKSRYWFGWGMWTAALGIVGLVKEATWPGDLIWGLFPLTLGVIAISLSIK